LSWTENVEGVTEIFFWYLLGSVPAFDSHVSGAAPLAYGENTFSGILNFFYRITGDELISPIQDWVLVPFPINVYTGIHPLYKDFGVAGVIFGVFAIGSITSYLYLQARLGKRFYVYLYALSLFPLLFVTFSDQYFAPVLSWIKYVMAGCAYFYFFREKNSTGRQLA